MDRNRYARLRLVPDEVVQAVAEAADADDSDVQLEAVSDRFAVRLSQIREMAGKQVDEDNPWHRADGKFGHAPRGSWSFQLRRRAKKMPHKASDGKKGPKSKKPCGRVARAHGLDVRCSEGLTLDDLRCLMESKPPTE